jgi:stage III sporulation protein AG
MNRDKILNELKKLLKDKKVSYPLCILLVLAFILIAINVFVPKFTNSKSVNTSTETADSQETKVTNLADYENEQKKELINILKRIEGIGEVDVMINFQSGEVKVPAYDTTTQTTITEETDKEGGKRINNQKNDGSTVVMTNDAGDNEPFILETYKPKVVGVIVVADGAKNSKTKSDIQKAVESLYDITANKVNVYPMK